MTWPESVEEALCFGWIDGVRRRVDDHRYTIRFTPRKPRSIWSTVNVRNVERLKSEGRMRPVGLAAFDARTAARSEVYAYENRTAAKFGPADIKRFKAQKEAWTFFMARPPSYRTSAIWWVVSAKKAETSERRSATLIADSAAGRTLKHLTRKAPG